MFWELGSPTKSMALASSKYSIVGSGSAEDKEKMGAKLNFLLGAHSHGNLPIPMIMILIHLWEQSPHGLVSCQKSYFFFVFSMFIHFFLPRKKEEGTPTGFPYHNPPTLKFSQFQIMDTCTPSIFRKGSRHKPRMCSCELALQSIVFPLHHFLALVPALNTNPIAIKFQHEFGRVHSNHSKY